MGSELRCQNFDLVKFREIIPRKPCYGTFFSQNFESEFSKNSDPPAEPKLESEFGQIPTRALGLTTWSECTRYSRKRKRKKYRLCSLWTILYKIVVLYQGTSLKKDPQASKPSTKKVDWM